MVRLKREKFVLLAKVGQRKREASAYREEAEFYCGNATELLALSVDLIRALQLLEKELPQLRAGTVEATSRLHQSIKQLLRFWPQNSDSQERLVNLLNSDGLATMVGVTADGYVSLSSTQVVENVARVIALTKVPDQKQSSPSVRRTISRSRGTSGSEVASI